MSSLTVNINDLAAIALKQRIATSATDYAAFGTEELLDNMRREIRDNTDMFLGTITVKILL